MIWKINACFVGAIIKPEQEQNGHRCTRCKLPTNDSKCDVGKGVKRVSIVEKVPMYIAKARILKFRCETTDHIALKYQRQNPFMHGKEVLIKIKFHS